MHQQQLMLTQTMELKPSRLQPFTVYGKLVNPYRIKTPNNCRFPLSERREDDLGVYMYWMIRLTRSGRYEVLKRLDPRYCESIEKLHALSHDRVCNLLDKVEQTEE